MTDNTGTAQHQPALKVAGRRLSVTTKHKPHRSEERVSPDSEAKKQDDNDYPRPSPTATDAPLHHEHGHANYEEEVPHKKEKKPNSERKIHWKSDIIQPTRDHNVGQKIQNIRISQPTGKDLNV